MSRKPSSRKPGDRIDRQREQRRSSAGEDDNGGSEPEWDLGAHVDGDITDADTDDENLLSSGSKSSGSDAGGLFLKPRAHTPDRRQSQRSSSDLLHTYNAPKRQGSIKGSARMSGYASKAPELARQAAGLDEKPPKARVAASPEGPLGRDLSSLAAKFQKEQAPAVAGAAGRGQKPLQIHLDVAAVEHQIDTSPERQGPVPERPGLLSHYLQLADIDQQRERLEHKQKLDHEESRRRKIEEAIRNDREKRKLRRMRRLRDQLQNSSLLRSRFNRQRADDDMRLSSGQVSSSEDSKQHTPAASDARSSNRRQLGNTTPLPGYEDQPADGSTPPTLPEKALVEEAATGEKARVEAGRQPKLGKRTSAAERHSAAKRAPSLRSPFSDMDLTQFLPFALSTPGLQSVIGSPVMSRANSADDLADWIKRHGRVLDAVSTPTNEDAVEGAILNEKRARLLQGIQKLLLHQRFICMLAEAMMQYGAPLHHLEDNLSRMARHLCVTATFTTMPGLVLISIEDTSTFTSETKIIRCPNGYDMHRLELTDRVFRKVSKDEMSVEDGALELDRIMSAEPLFPWYLQLLDWGLSSWSVCLLAFSGSWWDSLAALVLGTVVGCLNLLAGRLKGYTNLFEVSVSILAGFTVTVFDRWLCFGSVTLAATVVLLPGLVLTTGVIELASRNMHAGTIRVFYALMLAFIIAFGIDLGNNIFVEIFSRPERTPNMNMGICSPVSQWWWWLAFPVSICSICLLINVHPRHWHACVIVGGVMFAVFWLLAMHLKLRIIGPVVSAFVLGLAANIWSKLFNYNAYAVMLPGMMILVPGSVGVRGIMSMFNDTGSGASTQLAVQMVQTSLSIMVGLFASSFVVYPRGKKNSALLTV